MNEETVGVLSVTGEAASPDASPDAGVALSVTAATPPTADAGAALALTGERPSPDDAVALRVSGRGGMAM